ncbi:hypothetical protein P9747_27800, partial [Paenibacillus macerans]|uniref:hypothetical protein n=1 Tax=Paenibacillus macerans TaxID=44252 RepID=UPI002E1BB31B|nr:hypothetical protein [Paenibacillus macerans]
SVLKSRYFEHPSYKKVKISAFDLSLFWKFSFASPGGYSDCALNVGFQQAANSLGNKLAAYWFPSSNPIDSFANSICHSYNAFASRMSIFYRRCDKH